MPSNEALQPERRRPDHGGTPPIDADHMREAIHRAVAAKQEMDAALQRPALRALMPLQVANAAYSAFCAPSFMHALLPHLDTGNMIDRRPARIPLDCLIGESWRWRKPDPRLRAPDVLAAYLLDDARSADGDSDQAWVFQISPFGLYVACEGKNRVQFLRDHGARDMPAMVTTLAYPGASRLALYTLDVAGHEEYWCVLDGRHASRVLMPHLTTPLLGLLGVKPQSWPDSLSLLHGKAFIERRQECSREYEAGQPIDIAPLRSRLARDAEAAMPVDTSLVELIAQGQATPRWKPLRTAAMVFMTGCAGGLLAPEPWNDQVAMLMAALLGGAVITCTLPWLKARKRSLF